MPSGVITSGYLNSLLLCIQVYFQSNPSSLEYLVSATTDKPDTDLRVEVAGQVLKYSACEKMLALGVELDSRGNIVVSMEHRLEIGARIYWKHSQVLTRPGSLKSRMEAWSAAPGSSAIHGCGTRRLTRQLLHQLKRWEYKWLRRMFKFKFAPGEELARFNERTARKWELWFNNTKIWHSHHRVLSSIHTAAWHESGARPLEWARAYRDELWWQTVQALGRQQRLREGLKQHKSGYLAQWENVFVQSIGLDWKHSRN